MSYRLEHGRFVSDSLQKLNTEVATDTKNYRYQIYQAVQTALNEYQLLNLDKATIKYLKISDQSSQLPRLASHDIWMIVAQPKKAELKTFVGFIFTCYDPSTGGTDCHHEPAIFPILYESELPSTPPPKMLRVSLPLANDCGFKRGCLREKIPTPKGFHPVEEPID